MSEGILISAKTGEVIGSQPDLSEDEKLERKRAAMVCTPAQIRLELLSRGILDQVQAVAESDPEAAIVWEFATTIERASPLIGALAGQANLTDDVIDDIFTKAVARN